MHINLVLFVNWNIGVDKGSDLYTKILFRQQFERHARAHMWEKKIRGNLTTGYSGTMGKNERIRNYSLL